MSRRDIRNEGHKWKKMQKEGGRQVYENYVRKDNQVTLESRIVPWISAHGRKPEVDKARWWWNCKNELKSTCDSGVSCGWVCRSLNRRLYNGWRWKSFECHEAWKTIDICRDVLFWTVLPMCLKDKLNSALFISLRLLATSWSLPVCHWRKQQCFSTQQLAKGKIAPSLHAYVRHSCIFALPSTIKASQIFELIFASLWCQAGTM